MSVYVDKAKHAFRGMKMCHLMADTVYELHGMADKIGMARRWFQNRRVPHYDICQRQKKLAIKAGAVEIGWRQTAELMRKHGWRKTGRRNSKDVEINAGTERCFDTKTFS